MFQGIPVLSGQGGTVTGTILGLEGKPAAGLRVFAVAQSDSPAEAATGTALVTHPLFNHRVSYRRLLEIQPRLFGKLIDHEIADYPVFVKK